MKFAVIDVETTGLSPANDKITEIGVVIIENFQLVSEFTSLVNPVINIPSQVTLLTGISQEMVKNQPEFCVFAEELIEMTKDCIIVGHHVNFDYSFLKNEMRQTGISFTRSTLCTAELAQLLYPGKKSYSLNSLCRHHQVINENPHRALPDAKATAEVFLRMGHEGGFNIITGIFEKKKGSRLVPSHLVDTVYKTLPARPGVYYFIGQNNKPVYIGKATRLKSRVISHFRGDGNSLKILAATTNIKEIRYQETGNDILASLLEDHEIRHYWPQLNSAQKKNIKRFGVVYYMDQNNQWRMGITRSGKQHCLVISFHQYHMATEFIRERVHDFGLNSTLCGLPDASEVLPEVHNTNFLKMVSTEKLNRKAEIYFTKGRVADEIGFIWVERGRYRGFGFIPENVEHNEKLFLDNLTLRYSSITSETIIDQLKKKGQPSMVVELS